MARIAYYANESFYDRTQQGYFVAKITEDAPGYEQTFGLHRASIDAERVANKLNEANGLTRDDVLDIVASSMRAGRV